MRKSLSFTALVLIFFMVAGTVAMAETLVFNDDFSAGLGNWSAGCNTAMYTAPTLTIEGNQLTWNQGWDYIESNRTFTGNFRVEVDVERGSGSPQCKDFSIELANATAFAGAFRFQYGTYRKDSVLLGQAPDYTCSASNCMGACIQSSTSPYLREMDTVEGSPHTGTVSLTYSDGQITMSFKNTLGQTIQTPTVAIGDLGATKIRIAAVSDADRINAVRIYSLDNATASDCAILDSNNLNIDIPCLMFNGRKYHLRLLYDPTIQGGYYWKLDLTSIQEVD